MQLLEALRLAIRACADTVKWGAGIQESTRTELIADLQAICARCDDAYDAVLARLIPIKDAFSDPSALATELRSLAADASTRAKFKPEHLCGQIDDLLIRLSSNLDPLKYSIDCRRINDLRRYLQQFGDVDTAIFQSYDELVGELDAIATQIQDPASDTTERSRYAQHVIRDFERDLRETQSAVREAKMQTLAQV